HQLTTSAMSTSVTLFSTRSSDRRPLHSFPTRRSSDLPWHVHAASPPDVPRIASLKTPTVGVGLVGLGRWGKNLLRVLQSTAGVRSEEHTSELQSRENLVCRLLLEKKKK